MTKRRKIIATTAMAVVLAAGGVVLYKVLPLSAAEHSEQGGGHGEPGGAPGAMPVDVAIIKPQIVQIWKSFSGHVVAVDRAEIRPQVSGRITEIRFEDGQHVNEGDILMVIDPRPYEASLNAAKARAELARKELERAQELIKSESIAQRLMDERQNAYDIAQAELQRAEVDFEYTHVKAPISGKVSRAEITVGNLVQAGPSAPLLTSVVADEKVYVDFEVDEQTYIHSVRQSNGGSPENIPVRLSLQSVEETLEGYVQSFDNRIDPASGTIRARALFDNPQKILLPGMSVSVSMGGGTANGEQIILTEEAIATDQDRKFVYVIENGTATYREVKIGESVNGSRIILSGLKEGDQVITSGIMRLRPGVPVMPKAPPADATTKE